MRGFIELYLLKHFLIRLVRAEVHGDFKVHFLELFKEMINQEGWIVKVNKNKLVVAIDVRHDFFKRYILGWCLISLDSQETLHSIFHVEDKAYKKTVCSFLFASCRSKKRF